MRKIALLGASALIAALGVASASAEPRTADVMNHGQTGVSTPAYEGRAAAIDSQTPVANGLAETSRHAGR